MINIKYLLVFLFFSTSLAASASTQPANQSVDSQMNAWGEINSTLETLSNFSWKSTHIPGLIERVVFMADYVKSAVASESSRCDFVDKIKDIACAKNASSRLSFQEAFRCFDALAKACDKTEKLQELGADLPESYFDFRMHNVDHVLDYSDVYFLCVPNGGLKFERFVDGCFHKKPKYYVSLPNHELTDGVHGGEFKKVYDFFQHDIGHAAACIINDKFWPYFYPGYQKLKSIRDRLNCDSKERRVVDAFIFSFFHESFGVLSNSYNVYSFDELKDPDIASKFIKKVNSDIDAFDPFIDNMLLANNVYSVPIFIGRWALNHTIKEVIGKITALGDKGYCSLKTAHKMLIDNFLSKTEVRFEDTLEWSSPDGRLYAVPCTLAIDDIRKQMINVKLTFNGKCYSIECYGPQAEAKNRFEAFHLFKYAGYEGTPKQVSIYNYREVIAIFKRLKTDAATILKAQWGAIRNTQ